MSSRLPHAPRTSGYDHNRWLDLIEVSGPFLSVPVLRRVWPAGLDALDKDERERLRIEHADYFDTPAATGDREHWIRYVLSELLGWGDLLRDGADVSSELTLEVPQQPGEFLVPSFTLAAHDGSSRLLGLICDGAPTGRVTGSTWSASPADRLAALLRRHDVPLGLATDGRWWILVWAPRGGVTTHTAFDASLWREERDLARAFVSLLGRSRFFGVPDDETLPALLDKSQDNQEEITEALGVNVRRAVELLVDAIGHAEDRVRRARTGIPPLEAHEAYVGAVTVMMRLVFLLFAEDRGLLPSDEELYDTCYSANRLVDELEKRASEPGGEAALQDTTLAWSRLLALFRAVHEGVSVDSMQLPAYDGSLFAPDAHPWLEGRFHPEDDLDVEVLRISDRTVLHVLRAVQYVEIGTGKGKERRRLSFATLDVEQIGYVYEGLLGFDALRADDIILGLTGRPGDEAEVSLTELEDHAAACVGDVGDLAQRLSETYRASGIGSPTALAKKLASLTKDELPIAQRKLLSATNSDALLADRLLPFYHLLRRDLYDLPTVYGKGALYVTESPLRRNTGTHYTPKFLAKQVVEDALEPLVYSPGPLQTAEKSSWKPRSSAEILDLKVADIAMGSAAFLVAACRYLADRLVEAWAREGHERAQGRLHKTNSSDVAIDPESDPVVIEARRLIIEHCLYGVDINPMAVEMAKLSLWLVSMDPARPFTFVDDKLVAGDSLLGITSLDQLEWMHIDPRQGRKLHENRPWAFTRDTSDLAAEVAGLRGQISELDDSPKSYAQKRRLLAKAEGQMTRASLLADLVTGAALAGAGNERRVNVRSMEAANLARIAVERPGEGWHRIADQANLWLNIDRVLGSFARRPLHWPLVFPEVFFDNDGFDAIIGNPPFLGGKKISGTTGSAYREYLTQIVGGGVKGNADLVSFFVLRDHSLLNTKGLTGLIATNTLAQGDTREVGLDQIIARGIEIRGGVKSEPWPSKNAALYYCIVWTTRTHAAPAAKRTLDGHAVSGITSSLDPASRVHGSARRLHDSRGIAFQGSIVVGLGFTMKEERARELITLNQRNSDVLFPYLNGEDLNSSPDCSASRWIINFRDWSFERAAEYPDCLDIVRQLVKPNREKVRREAHRKRWWRYGDYKPTLYRAIAELDQVIAIALTSKAVMPELVPNGQVFSHMIGIFATDDPAMLALLTSAPHYWWSIARASTMKGDLRYTPTDVFETLALPELTHEMRDSGRCLHVFRRELMLARNGGLTKMYNLVHNPACKDDDIVELRNIHRRIDEAVRQAYKWGDLEFGHGFYDTRQGIRYTVSPIVRQEILDRLLELNHERYAEEVAKGLHDKKGQRMGQTEQGGLF